MSQINSKYPTIYNPATQSPEEIVSNFVIRIREFNELFDAIKNDKMEKPPQHFIIQGQRGYGKTTLLLRLNYEILNDTELNKWLLPVMFNEEQYNIRTLAKLWEEVIDILEDNYESFSGLSDKIDTLYDTDSPEENIFKLLNDELKKQNKKIVLLLDNFGDIIEKFEKKENQRLREVLITCENIRIIGASSAILEFYHNYKESFYDFFKVITLDELDRDETITLLRRLSETYKVGELDKILETQPERIEALRRLAGGVPRTIMLLFEIFIDDVNGNSFKDLELILDRVTPLYKHRLDNLSIHQQTIVDALAQNWDAMSAKDIALKIRMESKAVSSHLNQLEKSQLVKKISTSTKNQLYQLNERFFNIYYLMRLGKRKSRNKVLWLIRFFEIWCTQNELVERAHRHIKSLKEGRLYYQHALCVSQALSRTGIPDELQDELIKQTREYLSSKNIKLIKELDKSHLEVRQDVIDDIMQNKYDPARKKLIQDGIDNDNIDIILGNLVEREKKDYQKALEFYLKAIQKGHTSAMNNLALLYENKFNDYEQAKKYYLMAIEKGNAYAMYNLAGLYENEFKNYGEAKKYYLMAIEKGDADAMNSLAWLYEDKFKNHEEAKKYCLMAVEKGDVDAMYNLALLYNTEFKDYEEAKKYYLLAVEKGNASAMYNLALLYDTEFKDYEEAKKYYLMAIDKNDVSALNNLAFLYHDKFKNHEEAKKYYLLAVEKGNASAMYNLALLYDTEFKDYEEAKKYYLMAIEKNDVSALNNLAWLYEDKFKNYEEAKTYYLMAVEKGDADAMYCLASLYEDEFKDYEEAKKYYLMAIEKGNTSAMNGMAWHYYQVKENKKEALTLQKAVYKKAYDINFVHTYVIVLLWNNEIEEAIKVYKDNFNNENVQKDVNELVNSILLMFLAKKQYNFVYQLFKENKFDLKDKYKPIYFALLSLMGGEYKDEFLKMGSELKETVEEIITRIKQLEIDYA